MKRLIILLPAIVLLSYQSKRDNEEKKVFSRIEYIYDLKAIVGKSFWMNFDSPEYEVPLIYFTDSSSYVTNPTEKFIFIFRPKLVFKNKKIKIYKTHKRIDSIPFHMETSMKLGDKTEAYNHNSPFMNCSSVEAARQKVPGVNSIEKWATMIIHEYFHGFQYKHKSYLDYFTTSIALIPEDSLKRIYKNNNWFKQLIDEENDILLKALLAENKKDINSLIKTFLGIRESRRSLVKQKLHFDIEPFEKTFETMEGTARYLEYYLYHSFSTLQPDNKLAVSDTAFHSYVDFRNYKIENDQWLYLTSKTAYFYATGFNLARLLEKLQIKYKSRLFREGNLSLEDLLRTQVL